MKRALGGVITFPQLGSGQTKGFVARPALRSSISSRISISFDSLKGDMMERRFIYSGAIVLGNASELVVSGWTAT